MTTNLSVIANVKQLRTGGGFRILLPFFWTSWGDGVLNSAISNSFHNQVEFGTILEGLRNLGGFEPPLGTLLNTVTGRIQLKRDGTRRRTGGEVRGKLPNGVGNQYPSHHLWNMVYPALLPLLPLMRTPRLQAVDWTNAPPDLKGLVRFAERQNLARVPSHFKSSLLPHSHLSYATDCLTGLLASVISS